MNQDEILEKFGLTYEELSEAERKTLDSWLSDLKRDVLTVERVRQYIREMRSAVEDELTKKRELPVNWVSLLSLFVPFVGLMKKWYQDQNELLLRSRLKNYMLLEAFLSGPEKAQAQIERALANIKPKNGLT